MNFKMTLEERLALRFKYNKPENIVLNKFGVYYMIRVFGWSPINVARGFVRFTKGGKRELAKWAIIFLLRDLAIALPAIIVIIYTLIK